MARFYLGPGNPPRDNNSVPTMADGNRKRAGKQSRTTADGEDCIEFLVKKLRSGDVGKDDPPAEVFAKFGSIFGYKQSTFRNKLLDAKAIVSPNAVVPKTGK
jgi:hypothetical protein